MQEITIAQEQEYIKEAVSYFRAFCIKNSIQYFMIGGTMLGAIREKGFIGWDDDADFGMLRNDYQLFLSKIDLYENDKYSIEHYSNTKKVCHSIIRIRIKDVFFDTFGNYKKQYFNNLFFDIFPFDYLPQSSFANKQEKKLKKLKKLLYLKTTKNPSKTPVGFLKNVARCFIFSSSQRIAKRIDLLCFQKKHVDNEVCSMMSKYSYSRQTYDKKFFTSLTLYPFSNLMLFGPTDYNGYLTHLFGADYMIPRKDADITLNKAFINKI